LPTHRAVVARMAFVILIALGLPVRASVVDGEDPNPGRTADQRSDSTSPPPVPAPAPTRAVSDARPWDRTGAIYYVGGFGTPVGAGGGELVEVLGSGFEMTLGVGLGMAAAAAEPKLQANVLQWAAMPRLRFGGDRERAFTIGVGISGGGYGSSPDCNLIVQLACSYLIRYVIWANIEVGREIWSPDGWAFRYFAGYGHGFANGGSFNIPYLGLGIGRAF
jgi:hypothetical protein